MHVVAIIVAALFGALNGCCFAVVCGLRPFNDTPERLLVVVALQLMAVLIYVLVALKLSRSFRASATIHEEAEDTERDYPMWPAYLSCILGISGIVVAIACYAMTGNALSADEEPVLIPYTMTLSMGFAGNFFAIVTIASTPTLGYLPIMRRALAGLIICSILTPASLVTFMHVVHKHEAIKKESRGPAK